MSAPRLSSAVPESPLDYHIFRCRSAVPGCGRSARRPLRWRHFRKLLAEAVTEAVAAAAEVVVRCPGSILRGGRI